MSEAVERFPVALKEWAVTVQALKEGKLMLVMRKGGIVEETRDFSLRSPGFYLMPAYEHQKEHLLKEDHQGQIQGTLEEWKQHPDTMRIEAYAEAVEDIEITDQETLNRLRDFHIWTDDFAEERLKWKRTKPLHLLLLRVFRLDNPIEIPVLPSFTGCKSWVQLEGETVAAEFSTLPEPSMEQAIPEPELQAKIAEIKAAIAG
ncbi:DUF1802 family protein [Paenibacillus radicis (ex Gao et al. 2016)]|uniref:DUF1802 family protein n=1 Tax=Paenibacillus radicis (ex Gao et al. 2016) TaxID=1737354 RepID=A0A917M3A4_9BACL|nr:DUF1802 family protein [Paenibacillus radicis (ex Gao et al. 2016)]GGG75007.1 hypothetical protein GCM10010918_33990 [Paenibacillus radicis (ex Gao et al. 2016)]